MSSKRSNYAAVSLPGSILVVNDCDVGAEVDTAEALSIKTMHFAAGSTMLPARVGCAALALSRDY